MNLRNALRSEDTEQIQVVAWADWNAIMHPELKWLHHIPNGGSRNKAEAVKFKQMGVRSGISDLFLPCARGMYHGLYIEMKYGDGRLQQTQKEFLSDMTDDKRAELFGRQTDEGIVIKGLFEKEYVAWVSDKAMQEEIEQNRCGNPTQIHDFKTYLPKSYFTSGR